jgi:hypothetical protein
MLIAAIGVLVLSVWASKVRGSRFWAWALLHLAAIASAAVAGCFAGMLIVQTRYILLPKERRLIAHGIRRMENLIYEGNTNALLVAVQAFNRTLEGNMSRERSYEAAMNMTMALNTDTKQRDVGDSP